VLEKFKNLKLIATRSTGYNNIDLNYCRKHGIRVANVSGYGEVTVAEYAMGMLLNLTRKIEFANNKLRNGIVKVEDDVGIDLCGKTVGIIGTGAVGSYFAKLCHAFGCNTIASDPFPNQKLVDSGICKYVDTAALLRESDIVALNCPATDSNYHFIGSDTIAMMKDGVYIINIARGELIDPMALYEAVVAGKVKGAGLDVLDYENVIIKNDMESVKSSDQSFALYSLANAKLLQLPNVIITPHIAFNSKDAILKILKTNTQIILDFIDGKPVTSVI
jgi:D-lactate dehydrogenase